MSTQQYTYDPYQWLPSMFRAIREYVLKGIDKAAKYYTDDIGLRQYEIVFDYPASVLVPDKLPFTNADGDPVTLIHFEIDNIENRLVGFGESHIGETPYPASGTIVPEEAEAHEVNFDVGIWATDKSGGSTSRLMAYQALDTIFSGPSAQEACESATEGVLVRSFGGGRFISDSVNDIRLFRVADMELVCFVYSTKLVIPEISSDFVIVPELFIDETLIIDTTSATDKGTGVETVSVLKH
jgi:hypothetical protein